MGWREYILFYGLKTRHWTGEPVKTWTKGLTGLITGQVFKTTPKLLLCPLWGDRSGGRQGRSGRSWRNQTGGDLQPQRPATEPGRNPSLQAERRWRDASKPGNLVRPRLRMPPPVPAKAKSMSGFVHPPSPVGLRSGIAFTRSAWVWSPELLSDSWFDDVHQYMVSRLFRIAMLHFHSSSTIVFIFMVWSLLVFVSSSVFRL